MDQLITHACGHEQVHHLTGFASQQDRKARWLTTTVCRTCFITARKAAQAEAADRDAAALAHLALPDLVGSERQVSWASTIRSKRLAAMSACPTPGTAGRRAPCHLVTDATWWIDHRDLADSDLQARAERLVAASPETVAAPAA